MANASPTRLPTDPPARAAPRLLTHIDAPLPADARRLVLDPARPEPHRTAYNTQVKPGLDRIIAFFLVIALLPLMGLIAVVIRATMGNPILFRQRRVGLGGVPFDVLKFRTMRPDRRTAEHPFDGPEDRRRCHKTDDDPRHTPFGRFLRKWSLDELPQLFNVLAGEMSLVGPRPELVEIVATYEPHVHRRHAVKPGITGLWQVAARGDGLMHENPELDLEYVVRQSLLTDAAILARTPIAALLGSRGQ